MSDIVLWKLHRLKEEKLEENIRESDAEKVNCPRTSQGPYHVNYIQSNQNRCIQRVLFSICKKAPQQDSNLAKYQGSSNKGQNDDE